MNDMEISCGRRLTSLQKQMIQVISEVSRSTIEQLHWTIKNAKFTLDGECIFYLRGTLDAAGLMRLIEEAAKMDRSIKIAPHSPVHVAIKFIKQD